MVSPPAAAQAVGQAYSCRIVMLSARLILMTEMRERER